MKGPGVEEESKEDSRSEKGDIKEPDELFQHWICSNNKTTAKKPHTNFLNVYNNIPSPKAIK